MAISTVLKDPNNPYDLSLETPESSSTAISDSIAAQSPTPIEAQKAAPATREVTDKELTSRSLANIVRSDSPYITDARKRAVKFAGSRGLQNTSIAGSAGEASAISAALPIAVEDTRAYREAAAANQAETGLTNRFNVAEAGVTDRFNVTEAGIADRFNTAEVGINRRFDVAEAGIADRFNVTEEGVNRRFDVAEAGVTDRFNIAEAGINTRFNTAEENKLILENLSAENRQEYARLENMLSEESAVSENERIIVRGALASLATLVTTPGLSAAEITRASDIIIGETRVTLTVMESDLAEIFNIEEAPVEGAPTETASTVISDVINPPSETKSTPQIGASMINNAGARLRWDGQRWIHNSQYDG